jgi:hypothetical protein
MGSMAPPPFFSIYLLDSNDGKESMGETSQGNMAIPALPSSDFILI